MPQRFYMHSSGSVPVNPSFDAGWEQTGQAVRLPLVRKSHLAAATALTTSSSVTIPITTTQQICCYQFVGLEIMKPIAIEASILLELLMRCGENATTNNAFLAYVLRALRPDGVALAPLASSLVNTGTEFSLTGAPSTRRFRQIPLTPVVLREPWRLCLEIGVHAEAPSAAGSFQMRAGCSAASDFAGTEGDTADNNPYLDLSPYLNATSFNNYQHVGGSSSGWYSERTR